MRFLIAVCVVGVLACACGGKPAPPAAKAEQEKAAPALPTGETNWGILSAVGGNFTLTEHPQWDAIGQIRRRKDGSTWVFILWTLKTTGEACPGVYRIEGNQLVGQWGHAEQVQVNDDGEITGNPLPDVVRRVEIVPGM